MGLTTKGRIPQFQGNLRAIVPTPTFSGRLTSDPADSINPNTGLGPGTGGSGISFDDVNNPNTQPANVVALSPARQAAGSTTFVSSDGNYTWTPTSGGIQWSDTVPSQFGSTSLYFPDGGYLFLNPSADFQIDTGTDFTIELWYYDPTNAVRRVAGISNNNNFQFHLNAGFNFFADHSSFQTIGSREQDAWTHLAISRQGTTKRYFKNGVLENTVNDTSGTLGNSSGQLWLGNAVSAENFAGGYIDGFRIVKGTALYTANFTPGDIQ